ncbi:MAG: DegT/DnrJ/EryC1/StrS family aminotransferase [Gammaproteobacteria bacterium]|nr:DegT/DnrJ/EryC1/StrS family aminotransferase [Gammaproteobacteria bacterium]
MPFIDLKTQYQQYKAEIDAAVIKVMSDAEFIQGKEVQVLEQNLSAYTGAKHTIACANGTDALMLALMAIDIQPGDEVITPSFTFIATAEAAAIFGAKVVLVDINEQSYNIDINQLADKITPKTKAILPVALYGQAADMDEINAIAKHYGEKFGHKICVIEDAAQSLGAEYKGKKSGHLSEMGCTSFFPSKPLGCYGDGGAIFTDDDALAAKLRALSSHGQTQRYRHEYIGLNSRLDTIQAAILNVKLKYFEAEVKARHTIGARYTELLQGADCVTPMTFADRTHVYAQYSVRVKDRDAVVARLKEAGVPTAIHYPMPIHAQPCFKGLGYVDADFPVSARICQEILSLPMSPFLTEGDQGGIVNILKKLLDR